MLPESRKFEFGEFLLDTKEKVLLRKGKPVSITPKAFELLRRSGYEPRPSYRKERTDQVQVWAESFVEEANLPFTIGLLRKALGDDAQKPAFIETVPKRGYRFIADVREPSENAKDEVTQSPAPYVLVGLSVIVLLSLLVLSFVWFRGVDRAKAGLANTGLTTNGKVSVAAISPDGRTLVFARKDEGGESLWRREIESGAETELLPAAPIEFVGLAVSPDSEYAYYSVFSENAVASNFSRIPLTRGQARALPRDRK
jgi:DNA-binding winged helix-turn-helix (wHTH) protein